jgi:hypothetical protein
MYNGMAKRGTEWDNMTNITTLQDGMGQHDTHHYNA